MGKNLVADGKTGRVVIYDAAFPDAVPNPLRNMDQVFFHSDLNYMAIQGIVDAQITHPERRRDKDEGDWPWEDDEYKTRAGSQLWTIADHNWGRLPHAIGIINGGTVSGASVVQNIGISKRAVGIVVSENQVKVYESFLTYSSSLPPITVNYRVVLFTDIIQPSGNIALRMEPEFFQASRGKLRSDLAYLRRSNVGPPEFYFSTGKTIDVQSNAMRQVRPGGAVYDQTLYTGNFQERSVGVKT